MPVNVFRSKLNGRILAAGLAVILYGFLLRLPIPEQLGLSVRYDFTVILIPVIGLVFLAFLPGSWKGTLLGLGLILALFALTVSGLWASGVSEPSILGGLIPFSDAAGYYSDARRLLEGQLFSSFSSRRPLFAGMLAALLGLTERNLQLTLAVLVAITAVACYLLAREVQSTHGILAATLVMVVLFVYYRRFTGTTLTENLGLSSGALGLALLWRGGWQKKSGYVLGGIFLLTLALNARAGAFFILPALVVWAAWVFREKKIVSFPILAMSAGALVAGFLVNTIMFRALASPAGTPFANFSYTLYDLASGGKGWTQVKIDHPEIMQLSEPAYSQKIYTLAFEEMKQHPGIFVTDMLKTWPAFFSWENSSVFGFVGGEQATMALLARLLLLLLSVAGLVWCFSKWREPIPALLLAALAGTFLSVPFVPPWEADRMRVYAATLPFYVIYPAVGLVFLLSRFKRMSLFQATRPIEVPGILIGVSAALVAVVVIGPLLVRGLAHPASLATVSCPAGSQLIYARIPTGSYIRLVSDNQAPHPFLPDLRLDEFKARLHNFMYSEFIGEFKNLIAPTTITRTTGLADNNEILLVFNSSLVPENPGILGICGKWSQGPAKNYDIFYADSLQKVSLTSQP
ncbi:MAG: hypothetical protein ABSE06_00925 [Anaerolineaceae bacterium]|jgi:hypothetical protein